MTDLPDVVPNRMGGGSARPSHVVSVLSARAFISRPLCRVFADFY